MPRVHLVRSQYATGLTHTDGPLACILGSGIICVDILVRNFSSNKSFSIQDSVYFQASSFSLSFGVMVWMLQVF